MSKILLIFKQYKLCRYAAVLFLLHFNCLSAQKTITISYGEKMNLGAVDQHTHFYISGKINTHLRGNAINDFIFNYPGDYIIKVVEKKDHSKKKCSDPNLPEKILLKVNRIKMSFGNELSFSEPILRNKEAAGTRLNVNVSVQTFDHLPVKLDQSEVKAAGIGSAIVARPDASVTELTEGQHTIQYLLSGIVTENAYLMFDFIDANGKIQSIALTQPVKNKI